MKDQNKTKAQLIAELEEIRRRVSELENNQSPREHAEEELRFLSAVVEQSTEGMAIARLDGELIYINTAWCKMHGYKSSEKLLGKNLAVFHTKEQMENDVKPFNEKVKEYGTYSGEVGHITKDGKPFPTLMATTLLKDEQGAPIAMAGIAKDITERKQVEVALRESEARYRLLFDHAPVGILLVNSQGQIHEVNATALQILGSPSAEATRGINMLSFQPLIESGISADLKKCIEVGKPLDSECTYTTKWGKSIDVWVRYIPISNEIGTITLVQIIVEDTTERKRAEESLRDNQAQLAGMIDSAMDAIVTLDADQRIILFNPSAEQMFRCPVDEAIGQPLDRFIPERFRKVHREHIRVFGQTNQTRRSMGRLGPLTCLRADGEEFLAEISISQAEMASEKIYTAILRDITERKRAEEELRRRADEFAALYETARDLAVQHDLQSLLHTIVERARALLHAIGGGLYLYDAARSDLEMVLAVGFPVPTGTRLQLGEGMAGRVAQTHQPLVVDDYRTWEGRSSKYEGLPIRAVVQVPMLYAGELIGVLVVHEIDHSERKFTESDARLLSLFAASASGAVRSTRLFEETRKRAEETAALLDTSRALNIFDLQFTLRTIGERAKALFVADGCRIFLLEADGKTLRCVLALGESSAAFSDFRIKIGEGVTGAVVATAKAEIINEMQNDPRAVHVPGTPEEEEAIMFAPLKERGQTIGVISIRRVGTERPFQDVDLDLLKAFASMAASAVSNARLLEETQRRLERLSTLRRIDQVITSSLDLSLTLDILLGHVLGQLGVDAAAVLLYQPELQTLEFAAGQGFRTQALQSTNLRLGEGFAGRAALERRTVLVSDLSQLKTGFLRSPDFRSEQFVNYVGVPLLVKGDIVGVLEIYHRELLDRDRDWMTFLETLAGQAAIAIDNAHLFEDLQSSNDQLLRAYDATIEGWAQALELRDLETEGHSRRSVDLTLELARKMGIEESQLVHVRRGALLHDIGKMGIPDAILLKPGKLTDEEWEIMHQHPVYAHQWLASIPYLQPALDIPYCHHEKWDGTGYPRGLKGEQIPLAARIFAIIDVWDALRSDRPYRKAWSLEKALAYLHEQSGKHFDPQVVSVFLEFLRENRRTGQRH
jgi:PAS domain S-box-containing protein